MEDRRIWRFGSRWRSGVAMERGRGVSEERCEEDEEPGGRVAAAEWGKGERER
jgi:hypothetical protein